MSHDESPEAIRARFETELDYLAKQLDRVEARLPTEAELAKWREMAVADERASWARKKLAVIVPALVAVVVAIAQAWEWLRSHVSMK